MPEKFKLSEKLKKYQPHLVAIGILGFNTIGASILADQFPYFQDHHQLFLAIFGTFHFVGRIADAISTHRLTKKIEEVESTLKIDVPISETHPLLPKRTKIKDILRPDIVALELAQAIPLTIFPPYGLARGLYSLYAVNRNNRLRKSLIESTAR